MYIFFSLCFLFENIFLSNSETIFQVFPVENIWFGRLGWPPTYLYRKLSVETKTNTHSFLFQLPNDRKCSFDFLLMDEIFLYNFQYNDKQ